MVDGLLLGFLTWLSIILSFRHFPLKIKQFLLRHFVLADFLSIAITFLGLSAISHSLTAVAGAVVAGLLINITQYFYKHIHPELYIKQTKENSNHNIFSIHFLKSLVRKRDVSKTRT